MPVYDRRATLPRHDLSRYGSAVGHLRRQPARSREISADQLLIAPRADGDRDDRLGTLNALGIPVFRGVPPIMIVNPPRAERNPWEAPGRRRTR